MNPRFWLFKSEPETYSFETLKKEKKTAWNGVRNFQARNFLRECKKGDYAFIYHSGKERSIVGIAKILKEGYPEIDLERKGDWVQLDVGYSLTLPVPITLETIKKTKALQTLPLVKQSRLSCMPVSEKEGEAILKLGEAWENFQKLK